MSFLVTVEALWALGSDQPFFVWAAKQLSFEWKWPELYKWIAIPLGVIGFIFLVVILMSIFQISRSNLSDNTKTIPVESAVESADKIHIYSLGPNYSRLDSGWIAFHVEIINASLGDIKFVRSGTGHVAMEGRVYFNNSFLKEKPEFVPESSVVDLKRGGKGRLVFYQFLTDEEIQAVKEARRENDTSNTLRGPNHFNLGYITLGVSIGSKTSPFK